MSLMQPPGTGIVSTGVVRIIWIITGILWAASVYSQGKIRDVYTPHEIVAGDTFVVAIVANAPKAGIERMAAITIPLQVKFARAFMVNGSMEEPEPLELYQTGVSLFQSERGRRVVAVEQSSRPFPTSGSVVYYFVLVAPELNADMAIRAALAERGQEAAAAEPVEKPKKGKKTSAKIRPTSADPWQWQIVSPQTSEYRFSAKAYGEFEREIRCVAGWDNNSRALLLGRAQLMLAPEHITKFFAGPFTIEWWQQGIMPSTRVMTISSAENVELVEAGVNIFGQLYVGRTGNEASLISDGIVTDGGWHHIVWSRDDAGLERLFVDAVLEDTITHGFMPDGISSVSLGDITGQSTKIDELHFIHRARETTEEFAGTVAIAVRDTLQAALAIFHFEELANVARSSIPLRIPTTSRPTLLPITLRLDGKAKLVMTSSPILLEHAVLTLDQSTASKVGFNWKASSEYNTVRYELQRRVATFGSFEKIVSVPVRRPVEKGEDLISRSSYSAAEKLPTLKRDIDIYYRLAVFGANDSLIDVTTPLKFELGGPKDIFLEQNKPNPFNPKTTIGFTLKRSTAIKLSVFDIIGREVLVVANKKFPAGRHAIEIDATNWPGGIYFYKLKSGNTILTRRMVLAK
jgi:hypothetical protein